MRSDGGQASWRSRRGGRWPALLVVAVALGCQPRLSCSCLPNCDDGNPCTNDSVGLLGCEWDKLTQEPLDDTPTDEKLNHPPRRHRGESPCRVPEGLEQCKRAQCQAGRCVVYDASEGRTCGLPPDDCHQLQCKGGFCQSNAFSLLACDDQNACTLDDICQSGTCTGGRPLQPESDCPTPSSACAKPACDPAQGCVEVPSNQLHPGDECDDDVCTRGDHCEGATCVPGPALDPDKDCPTTAAPDCVAQKSCDPQTGCDVEFKGSNEPCTGGNPCLVGATCALNGDCSGGSECPPPTDPCSVNTCNPQQGCHLDPKPNGTGCSGFRNACFRGSTCQGGACQLDQPDPSACAQSAGQCTKGVCQSDGSCSIEPDPAQENDPCTDGADCVRGKCNRNGECVAAPQDGYCQAQAGICTHCDADQGCLFDGQGAPCTRSDGVTGTCQSATVCQ